jgi:REP element-mobilizing transposase RayT
MARRRRILGPGLLYHVVARGNRRETVFPSPSDYESYLHQLVAYRTRYAVNLYGYCLMPNHVHLLVRTAEVSLDRFMQGVQQSYTQRFNDRHGLVGHVFQGRYKAFLCETDEYLLTLVRYVHQNPVRAGLARCADDYPYSGHHAYAAGVATELVDPTFVLTLVGGPSGYERLIASDSLAGPPHPDADDAGRPERPPPAASLAAALSAVARGLRVDVEVLRSPGQGRLASQPRALAGYLLARRLGYRLSDVAAALGRTVGTTSLAIRGIEARVPADDVLARRVAELESTLELQAGA